MSFIIRNKINGRTLGFGVLEEVLLLKSLLDLFTGFSALDLQRFKVAGHTCSAMALVLQCVFRF
jgi:hypothetical protein